MSVARLNFERVKSFEIIVIIFGVFNSWSESQKSIILLPPSLIVQIFMFSILNRIATPFEVIFWKISHCFIFVLFNVGVILYISSILFRTSLFKCVQFLRIGYCLFSLHIFWVIECWIWSSSIAIGHRQSFGIYFVKNLEIFLFSAIFSSVCKSWRNINSLINCLIDISNGVWLLL